MSKHVKLLIGLNLMAFVAYFLFAIYQKEQILKEGEWVLFELAPVDPRSLMQGDYMELAYALSENIDTDDIPRKGILYLNVDEHGVAQKIHFEKSSKKRIPFAYRVKNDVLCFGADSFFFQEGQADLFENAKYGGYKVNVSGESVLIGLYDAHYNKIEAP